MLTILVIFKKEKKKQYFFVNYKIKMHHHYGNGIECCDNEMIERVKHIQKINKISEIFFIRFFYQ